MDPQIQLPVLEPVPQKSFISRYEWPIALTIILFLLLLISFIWWPLLKEKELERINAQNNTPIAEEQLILDWRGILKNNYGVEFEIPENYSVQYADNLQEPTIQVWHLSLFNGSTTDSVLVNISGLEKAYNNETCPPIDYLWPDVKELVTLSSGQKVSICKRVYSDSSVGYSFFIKTKNASSQIIEIIAYSSPSRSEEALRMLKEMLLTFKFSDPSPIKPAKITGYYIKEKQNWYDSEGLCDELVIMSGDKEFIDKYKTKDYGYYVDKNGYVVMNINLNGYYESDGKFKQLSSALVNKITNSKPENPVTINVKEYYFGAHDLPSCYSPVHIIE